jgi:pectate lyase
MLLEKGIKMSRVTFLVGFTVISLFYIIAPAQAFESMPIGWASLDDGNVPYTITGGSAGDTVTATDEATFKSYATSTTPYVILVPNMIVMTRGTSRSDTPQTVNVESNKTIIGIGSNAGINGGLNISGKSNIIIRNLSIWYEDGTNQGSADPWTDGISIQNSSHHIWVDHCTFYDSPDGLIDTTKMSNYVTISWCKFYYTADTNNTGHHFTCLVGGDDDYTDDRGKLKVTFHHNWWTDRCKERMPRVRFGQVHVYNNYYSNLMGGGYCHGVGVECQILVENNYYYYAPLPWKNYSGTPPSGKIGWNTGPTGNQFVNTTIPTWATNDYNDIFVPPYSYTMDSGANVNTIVQAGAGAGKDITPPEAPTGLTAITGEVNVPLDWNDNNEPDLAGYNVYRSTTSGSGYAKLNDSNLVSDSNYIDDIATHDTTYYYVVTAVDTNSNESNDSNEVFSGLYGDFTGNAIVEMNDLPDFLDFWLVDDCDETSGLDLDDDCIVNFYEFSVLAENWLQEP